MSKDDELKIVMLPQVQAQIDSDPELAKAVADFVAALHQAEHAVKTGQHKSMDDAIEAITGNRPEKIVLDDMPSDD